MCSEDLLPLRSVQANLMEQVDSKSNKLAAYLPLTHTGQVLQ